MPLPNHNGRTIPNGHDLVGDIMARKRAEDQMEQMRQAAYSQALNQPHTVHQLPDPVLLVRPVDGGLVMHIGNIDGSRYDIPLGVDGAAGLIKGIQTALDAVTKDDAAAA